MAILIGERGINPMKNKTQDSKSTRKLLSNIRNIRETTLSPSRFILGAFLTIFIVLNLSVMIFYSLIPFLDSNNVFQTTSIIEQIP